MLDSPEASSGSLDDDLPSPPLRPRGAVITFFIAVFTVAAVFLLYKGATTGDYLLVALVLVAYVVVLMLEASLSLRPRRPPANPTK